MSFLFVFTITLKKKTRVLFKVQMFLEIIYKLRGYLNCVILYFNQ